MNQSNNKQMKNLTPAQSAFDKSIIDLKENNNLELVESMGYGGSVHFLIKEVTLFNYTVQIVKAQWTKTQKTYCIRILNFETGNKPNIQIPNYKLGQAKKALELAEEQGFLQLWTGHTIKA